MVYTRHLVGRYANRIGGAKFVLNGETFELFKNNGGAAPNFKNSLHGGKKGFDKYVWESKIIENGIELNLVSNHMDEVSKKSWLYLFSIHSGISRKTGCDCSIHSQW